jgi:hypothetical protein
VLIHHVVVVVLASKYFQSIVEDDADNDTLKFPALVSKMRFEALPKDEAGRHTFPLPFPFTVTDLPARLVAHSRSRSHALCAVFWEGDVGDKMYVILSGTVSCWYVGGHPTSHPVSVSTTPLTPLLSLHYK